MRRAKIIATLGPASNSFEKIKELIKAGLDVARINMSHGDHAGHKKVIANIRQASLELDKEVAVLLDLQGPKIRVDKLQKPLELKNGEEWVIGESSLEEAYPQYRGKYIPTIYKDLVKDCHDGARILFSDGLLSAVATEKDGDVYKIKITNGGLLTANKGINLPDCDVSAPSFGTKDRDDLMFGLAEQVDYVALSFVRKSADVLAVKALLHRLKCNIPVVAKIEKPQAVDNLDDILSITDIIMVARGDMGVEVGNHLVPAIQKDIINKCNRIGTPVIIATQMLESMMENPTPTRAEASDVANAIWDGADAVMLSGETAAGKYPLDAVKMMDQIVLEAEKIPRERPLLRNMDLSSVNAATMVAASMVAEKVEAKQIIAVTESGHSCLKISRFRPQVPVLGVTNSMATARRLAFYWGITPFYIADYDWANFDFQVHVINKVKHDLNLTNGDKVVISRGDGQFFAQGSSNSVKVEIIKDMPKIAGGGDTLQSVRFSKGQFNLDTSICGSCQNCVTICPHHIWKVTDDEKHTTYIDSEKASFCEMDEECIKICPTGAIELLPNSH